MKKLTADLSINFAAIIPSGLHKSRAWNKLKRNKSAVAGLIIIKLFILLAFMAPILPIADPFLSHWSAVREAPNATFWFGTDEIGRDLFSRMIWGARASLMAGVISVCIALAFGVPLGLLAGYFGGVLDIIISRATDALLATPFLILAIALAAFMQPSLTNAMIAIGISAMPIFIRLTRGQVLSVKNEEFVESARSIGLSNFSIIAKYIFPNVFSPILVQATLTVATAIIAEASLSFLGLGQQPPNPSWGSMLNIAKNFLLQAPWMAAIPGIAIFIVVLGFNLLGDGLRDAFDPKET